MILFCYIIINQNIGVEMRKLFIKSLSISDSYEEEKTYTIKSLLTHGMRDFQDGITITNEYNTKKFGKAYVVSLDVRKQGLFENHIVEIIDPKQKIYNARYAYVNLLKEFKIIDEESADDLLSLYLTSPVFSVSMNNKTYALLAKDEYVYFENFDKILHGIKIEFNVYTYKFFITVFDYEGVEVIQLLNNAKYLGTFENIKTHIKNLMQEKLVQKYTKELGYKVTEKDLEERIDDFNALIEMRRI